RARKGKLVGKGKAHVNNRLLSESCFSERTMSDNEHRTCSFNLPNGVNLSEPLDFQAEHMKKWPILCAVFVSAAENSRAGMTVYDLNDVVRLRLEDISFFLVLLALCTLGVRFVWNVLQRDFPKIPRLTFGRELCLTGLL